MPDISLTSSVSSLLEGLHTGRWTSRDLVRAHLARIEAINPVVNAVVATRPERALEEARRADARIREGGELSPLLGVPCTVKEFIAVEGMPWTSGLVARRGVVASEDAVVVQRLREAGAIVLGVTNVPEGGLWAETVNKIYGRTSNPWDPRRTSGGSSGGEGAIIAAGGSPFGLGSDIGGSVRIPAGLCGVVGHKPSGGLIPTLGHHPPGTDGVMAVGPLARTVDDVIRLLRVLVGPHPDDPISRDLPFDDPDKVDPDGLTVHLVEEGLSASTPPIRAALEQSAAALEQAGATVMRTSIPELSHPFRLWLAHMSGGDYPTYAEVLGDGPPAPIFRELARSVVGRSRHTLPPLLVAATEVLARHLPVIDTDAALAELRQLAARLQELLEPRGLLLLPTFPRTAPRHHGYLVRFADSGWCGVANVLQLPATSVPMGRAPDGLPMGAQLVGLHGQDALPLAAAAVIEDRFGGFSMADGFQRG